MPGQRNSPKAFSDWYESDYFRRPRRPWLLTGTILAALAVTGAAVALSFKWPRAYEAGPLSDPHAFLSDNCAACHTGQFKTAERLLPGHGDVRSTPDTACLECHKAGVHHPDQTQFVGPVDTNGQFAANCAGCHHEHNGGESIARLEDAHCIACHENVHLADGKPNRFAASIHRFDSDHPEFGAWRGKPLSELPDPGTLKFNHKKHLDLVRDFDGDPKGRNGWMSDALNRLKELNCTSCHEPDNDRHYMRPISYDRHCAACHPLTTSPAGYPNDRLQHPKPGQTAADVRGELLQRFWDRLVGQTPTSPRPADNVLNRGFDEKKAQAQRLARQEEARQFQPGGYELSTLERPHFVLKSGCEYCHEKNEKPLADGLPDYKPTRLRDRWQDVSFPYEKFGTPGHRTESQQIARDRWFPYSHFSHESHRMLDCVGCHMTPDKAPADQSEKTSDVLMPTKAVCMNCHNRTATGVRSDCLECHNYHDRSAEPRGLHGRMTVEDALRLTTPASPGR
jgi:hypothetical protein